MTVAELLAQLQAHVGTAWEGAPVYYVHPGDNGEMVELQSASFSWFDDTEQTPIVVLEEDKDDHSFDFYELALGELDQIRTLLNKLGLDITPGDFLQRDGTRCKFALSVTDKDALMKFAARKFVR